MSVHCFSTSCVYRVINKSKFKVNTYMVYPEAGICVPIEDKLAMGFRARCILHGTSIPVLYGKEDGN